MCSTEPLNRTLIIWRDFTRMMQNIFQTEASSVSPSYRVILLGLGRPLQKEVSEPHLGSSPSFAAEILLLVFFGFEISSPLFCPLLAALRGRKCYCHLQFPDVTSNWYWGRLFLSTWNAMILKFPSAHLIPQEIWGVSNKYFWEPEKNRISLLLF